MSVERRSNLKSGLVSPFAQNFPKRHRATRISPNAFVSLFCSLPPIHSPRTEAKRIAVGAPIPVLDKTGLSGIYDFAVDIRPEAGTNVFAVWQRVLRDQLGLRLESGRADVSVVVVDNALQVPIAN